MFEIFNILFANPITNLLVGFYQLLFTLHIPYAFGFSIILLTVFIRILLYPLISAQIKSAHDMQKIAPHLSRVKEKYKDDKKRQQEEMMKLYKEHSVNPAAGCLPLIIQLPIIWSLYNVLTKAVVLNTSDGLSKINQVLYFDFLKIDKVWDTIFFGLPLGANPSSLMGQLPLIILVPILTGVFQFILSKMMMPEKVPQIPGTKEDDFQAVFQKQSLYIFPVMIGFFSLNLPIGLSLYWNTFTIFGILQQYLLLGPGSAAPIFQKINLHGRNK
ncbi:MAG: hypothetical protein A3C27_02845 [Candidatus Levybacteria bacterium RIFCSPHIGHO2_02_FULL_39_36]|nr:MAG: 60 kDa inner membrane insertion protein [Candidatus Levybacteria bacterium GW2011_GWA1_39_11]KKR24653.1 MAG: 60 kDa inner membrane insertion protein [Candidatus Levybacteria bacterium GW2011_GWB1_39_7]KKR49720.1 MAG: 60 kDa inner membrane insertion protein [Candidatus Levybacteria bacterium GW2011_GWA2_40_16]OGH15584.1 MAG: hypothetical protein A2689_01620 [Candidatus Levybacteria bacterium RIFCSPHIGHO2_01_FULL_38_96]OGH25677.1 MAG: hypothetical protein A3E68_02755 [Candidatus Levybacte